MLRRLLSPSSRQSLPAPQSPRELLLALKHYDDEKGLDAFLERFDFAGVSPHQVYASVLGRLPESAQVAATPADYDPRQHLKQMLLSSEFQSGLIMHLLRAFPEKQRLVFVHVPKCAGSDLASHLMRRYEGAFIGQLDQDPLHIAPERLPWRLQMLIANLHRHDTIAVTGHIGLHWLLSEKLLRFGDVSFTVIRDPVDMAVSKVNYVLTLMQRDPSSRTPLVMEWIRRFNLQRYSEGLPTDAEALKQIALTMLRDTKIVPQENICSFLGSGTARSALDLCASANIELTTVSRYDAWLKLRWGIERSERVNESNKILTRTDLTSDDLGYLGHLRQEDLQFYQRIDARIAASGRLSIFGAEV